KPYTAESSRRPIVQWSQRRDVFRRLIQATHPLSSKVMGGGTVCPGGVRALKCCAAMLVSVTSSCTRSPPTVPTSTALAGSAQRATEIARQPPTRRTAGKALLYGEGAGVSGAASSF